jgi:hypothetical protein
MNLLMCAPLRDSRGTIRYFIGAQVDVSGLVKECTELESLQRLLDQAQNQQEGSEEKDEPHEEKKDEFQELSEMLNMGELATVRKHGGRMHREAQDDLDSDSISVTSHKPRLLLKEHSPDIAKPSSRPIDLRGNGRLGGVYQHVRRAAHPLIAFTNCCSICWFGLTRRYEFFLHPLLSESRGFSSLLSSTRLGVRTVSATNSPQLLQKAEE